jgi:hypothetical protein
MPDDPDVQGEGDFKGSDDERELTQERPMMARTKIPIMTRVTVETIRMMARVKMKLEVKTTVKMNQTRARKILEQKKRRQMQRLHSHLQPYLILYPLCQPLPDYCQTWSIRQLK